MNVYKLHTIEEKTGTVTLTRNLISYKNYHDLCFCFVHCFIEILGSAKSKSLIISCAFLIKVSNSTDKALK